jgi:hypothetical protein
MPLGWLPILELRNYHLPKLAYKAMNCDDWPSYLILEECIPIRTLRSSSARRLVVPIISGNFQDEAARMFNSLPLKKFETATH